MPKLRGIGDVEKSELPFRQQLLSALEHFDDVGWLSANSALATPYFLGEHIQLHAAGEVISSCGQGLRAFILETASTLLRNDPEKDYLNNVLELSFFRPKSVLRICEELNISRATYYRHRNKAIDELEKALIRRLRPALRLEPIPAPVRTLLGRQEQAATCLQLLCSGNTIALTGSSGIGKTTLGAYLAREWTSGVVFWFTLRPGLNDQLPDLLFSLGYFLQRQGKSSLWLQMVANSEENRETKYESVLSLVRHHLQDLKETPPLLCFDEIDLLKPLAVEKHSQLLSFLESLVGLTPLLFIGQQIPLKVHSVQLLEGLTAAETEQMLAGAAINLSAADLSRLQAYTQGNPGLLELFITLHRSGESLADLLSRMTKAPSAALLLKRIQQRLLGEEQMILAALAIFRRPAPDDVWENLDAFKSLYSRRLIQLDGKGGVMLLPALQSIIYQQLSPEERKTFHRKAAVIRAERGEYTAATYHYIRGQQPEVGIWLWYMHRRQEIDQGQGGAALELFKELPVNELDESVQEILILLRSELRMLAGEYSGIKRDLYTILWSESLLKGRAKRLEGNVAYEQSHFDAAIRAFREGLETIHMVSRELALLHKEMGKVYAHKRDLEAAWRETLYAQYEVENLKGSIQSDMGNFTQALVHYENALDLVESLNYTEGEGKTRNNLAWVLKQQGEFEKANQHWQRASECYAQVGRLTWQMGIKINQAISYTETGQPRLAIPLLEEALTVFRSLGHSRGLALAAFNLAEAYLAVGDVTLADHYIWKAIEEDEPSVLPASFNTLAEIRLAQQRLDEAERFCHKSIQLGEKHNDVINCAYSWRTLGKVLVARGQREKAQGVLDKAITLFEELEMPQEVKETQSEAT